MQSKISTCFVKLCNENKIRKTPTNFVEICNNNNRYKIATDYSQKDKIKYDPITGEKIKKSNAKFYSSFSTYISFYNHIIKNPHIYELITTDLRKPHFDLDNFELTKDEFNKMIDVLINETEKNYNTTIQAKDVKISVRGEDDDDARYTQQKIFRSAHIIIDNGICVNFITQQYFANYLKTIIPYIDNLIYTKNRCLKLPKMSKAGSLKKPSRYYDDYYEYKYASKYEFTEYEELKSHLVSVPIVNNLIEHFGKCVKQTEPEKVKKVSADNDKLSNVSYTIFGNDIVELYNHIKKTYNPSYYIHSTDWKLVSGILFNNGVLEHDIWSEISANNSSNKWTKQQNIDFLKTYDSSKIKNNSINLLIKITNKYSDETIKYNNKKSTIDIELCKWIADNTNLNVENIQQHIYDELKLDNDLKVVNFCNDTIKYNLKTGFLNIYDENDKCILVKNYRDEVLLLNTQLVQLNADFEYDNIRNVRPHVKDFIENKLDNIAVKAMWGVGKSHTVLKPIIEALQSTHRIIILTENNAINSKFQKDYPFLKSHQQEQNEKNTINFEIDSVIISMESVTKLRFTNKKILLVLDEFESIINHFQSSTIKNTYDTFVFIRNLCKSADKCVLLDADISNARIDVFKKWRSSTKPLNTEVVEKQTKIIKTLDNTLVCRVYRASKQKMSKKLL